MIKTFINQQTNQHSNQQPKKNSKLKILSLINPEIINKWKAISASWDRYFLIEHLYDKPTNLDQYLNKKLDFLFLFQDEKDCFKQSVYNQFKLKNSQFHFVIIKPFFDLESDIRYFKALADDIIHLDQDPRWLKWKTISILRRYWDTHSKPTTIIYKNLIADFIDNLILREGQTINLTPKESKLLRFLLENRGIFKTRHEILKAVWDYEEEHDSTRIIDQIMFKIRQKIGPDYFKIKRKEGIKFE